MERKDLSLIIPVYNAENIFLSSLDRLCESLGLLNIDWEILLRNDGSTDGSSSLMREADSRKGIRCFDNGNNEGFGRTMRRLIADSRGRKLIYLDIDLPFRLEILSDLVRELDEHDLVVVSRYVRGSSRSVRLVRMAFSRLYYAFCRVATGVPVKDIGSGMVGIQRDALEGMSFTAERFEFHLELLIKAGRKRLRIKEIPGRANPATQHTFSLLRHGPQALTDTLRLIRIWK